eukprot:3162836-Pyramimonas_sp.AAC.1
MRLSSNSPEIVVQLAARAYRDFVEASGIIEATISDKLVVVGSSLWPDKLRQLLGYQARWPSRMR